MTLKLFYVIFFRFFNFALLIVFIRYVYKKYLYAVLSEGVQSEHEALRRLEHEADEFRQKRIALDTQFRHDQELIVTLKQKMRLWIAAEHEQRKKRDDYKIAYSKKLHDKALLKEIRITEYMIERESLPLIIAKAREHLEEHYRLDKESDRYIEWIVTLLNQESSTHECR